MEEYIYKNSRGEKPCTVQLHDDHLGWECGTRSISLNYDAVIDIRLNQLRGTYKITIVSDIHAAITISNRFYHSDGKFEDRSRQYSTFVRLLHFHLKQKSGAFFFVGSNWVRLIVTLACLLLGLFALQYLIIEFDFIRDPAIHQWIVGTDVALLIGGVVLAASQYPRPYSPDNIPVELLPGS